MAHIANRGYPQEIVGESYYTRTLKQCYYDQTAERIDSRSVAVPVLLKYKGDTVRVISKHGRIGDLPSEEVADYRRYYGTAEHTTMCKVYTRSGDIFGAYLSLTITEHTSTKVLAKNLPNHEAFAPKPQSDKKGFFARLFGL